MNLDTNCIWSIVWPLHTYGVQTFTLYWRNL